MRLSLWSSLIVAVGIVSVARADGLIYQLPANGMSVRYDLETKSVNNGQEQTRKGSLTVSSVGQADADGQKCRWIEFKSVTQTDQGDRITIAKLLIPEEHLARGKSPGDHLIRGWFKMGDQEPREIKDLKTQGGRMMLAGYLAGPPQNGKELEAADVESELGKLSCKGVTGDHEFIRDNGTLSLNFENRLNDKSPFGVVSAVWKFEFKQNGQVMRNGTTHLKVAGTNPTALTELPDRN